MTRIVSAALVAALLAGTGCSEKKVTGPRLTNPDKADPRLKPATDPGAEQPKLPAGGGKRVRE